MSKSLFTIGKEPSVPVIARKDTIREAIAVATENRDYDLLDKLRVVLEERK